MNPAVVAEIDARLASVERAENAKIGFAIESGSRAWGFPSPDSDYDCRFVYVRPRDDYLALFPHRDVIETPVTPVFDVNGWDLHKALRLLLNGNAVIIEWLTSPIVYRADPQFRSEFLTLANEIADRQRIAQHYIHLARGILSKYLKDSDGIPLKKIFYVLRPVTALRWLRLNQDAAVAPMNFQQLCDGCNLGQELKDTIDELVQKKSVSRELGQGSMPAIIRDFIDTGLEEADRHFAQHDPIPARSIELANAFFRRTVQHFSGDAS